MRIVLGILLIDCFLYLYIVIQFDENLITERMSDNDHEANHTAGL